MPSLLILIKITKERNCSMNKKTLTVLAVIAVIIVLVVVGVAIHHAMNPA
jgi:hypothetical protein